jgi:acetyl esterase/lipase
VACLTVLLGNWSSASAAAPPAHGDPPVEPVRYAVKAVKDVTYYEGAGQDPRKHKLDLFLPVGLDGFPVLLFVHGGAWLHGDKDFYGFYSALGRALAARGVGVVVTNYRLSPGVKHPEHVKDVARAFAWTHRNIAKHGGRPDSIFVSGHSAGGHLVSLLATDERYLRAEGLTTRALRGVIAISGVYNIAPRFLPVVFGTGPEAGPNASPLRHARAGLPPFLVLWADRDMALCGRAPSEAFVKALRNKGNSVEAREVAENNHYSIIISARPDGTAGRALLGFIRANTVR